MNKIGLVLEGGGMRGAYTAGALSWLLEHGIEFEYGAGISSGAVYICCYYMHNEKLLKAISSQYMCDKKNVGIVPLLKEGRYVGYDYMFDHLLKDVVKFDTTELKNRKDIKVELGVFDCELGDTIFYDQETLDDDLRFLKAACTLPIAGRIVKFLNHKYLDGGIKVMIPIDQSIKAKNDKHFVITTKPEGYVRKEAKKPMVWFMKMNYLKYPKVLENYRVRAANYNKQMDTIYKLMEEDKAFLLRPSMSIPVKRFSGDPENLQKLYDLGYQDAESRKDEIFEFLGVKND